ncbi:hypothetical protein Agub_g460, partial [Astrephomene gubernaculifera]
MPILELTKMDTGPSATAPSTEDKGQDAKLGWGSLPALVLETIGSILVKEDGNNGRSDALRARMACKHWHACLTCCISSATLYGSALLVPPAPLLPHPPPSPSPSPLPAAAAPVCGCFGPSLTHLTISGPSFHLAWLPLLAAHLPSLTSLSLRAARYHRPWHSPLQRAATTAGPAADAAAPPPAPTDATAGGAGTAAHAHAGPATSAAAAAAVGGQVPTQAAAAAAVASLAGLPVGSLHLAESALNLPSGSLTALVSASLAAAGADEAPLQQQLQGGGGCWPWASISAAAAAETPHSPQLQSRGLRRLEILISDDTPPDILTRVLPLLLPPPPEPVGPPPAPSWSAAALPPLRELILLPATHATQAVSAAVHQQQHQQRMSYLDLAPLFSDPRLRGVTRLVVPSLQRRAHVAMAAGEQQGGGAGAGQQQQQLQQQPAGQEEDVVQQLGRLTQLRSLSVLDQVELASFAPACLTHLTGLRQLSLSGGVFVEGVGELRLLTGLKLLRSLDLDFRTEWWLDAGDLAVLSRLSALRRLQLSLDYGLDSADSDWDVMYTPPHEVEEDAEEEEEAKEEVGEEEASEDKNVGIMSDEDLDQWFWSEVREAWRREGALARLRQQRQPRRPLGMRYRMDRLLRGPGGSDNWQKALGPLTQLTSLGLRLRHGGGRHLAAGLHDAQWLTPRQRKCRRRCRIDEDGEDGSDGDDRDDETDGGNSNGRSDGGSGGDSDGGGVVLELYDAPDVALLDVDFWAKIVSTEQQASTSSSPAAATESAPPPPPLPPLRRQPTCRAPPLVSLTLGGSGQPLLSYGNILCLGLMTDLRSLSLRFETERRMGLQRFVIMRRLGLHRCSYPRFNPLVALSSLRQLRKLHVLVKHDPQGHGGGGSGGDQAGTAHVAVIDDDVVRVWMYGMPFLQDLSLRDAGRLGERGLSAIGLHGDLRSLRLDLRPLTTMKHASAAAAAAAAALKRQPWDIHEGNASGGGGDAAVADTASRTAVAASMVGINASDEGTDISSVRIGYGSYYAISAVEVSAPMCPGDDGTSGGAATPTLGVSPPAPWHFTAAVAAAAGAPKWKQSGDDAVGSPAGGSNRGGGGGGKGSSGGAATAVVPVSERAAVRDRRLAEGAMLDSELLAALPYLIRPHHLPPSLAALHLTNAVFSSEWAAFCAAPADLQKTTTKHASAGFPAAATPAHATTPGSAPPGEQLEATLMPPAPSLRRPLARLARLTLRRRPCSSISSLLRTPRIAGRWMGLRSASSGGGGDVSQAAGQPVGDEEIETEGEEGEEVEKEGAAHFDPTRLTDWHLVYFLGCQPCLAHLWLEDPAGRERVTHGSAAPTASGCGSAADDGGGGGGGGGAGVAPKLHHRAIAQLGRLRYLESLTLKVGNRLRWSAQEALFARLPPGLRRLQLHAADLYQEAVRGATRLTDLAELQVIDYTEPSYVPELAEAVRFVQRSLPNCSVV